MAGINPSQRVEEVRPSFYFSPVAEVLITACGHRHVRPSQMYRVGDFLSCPFCGDEQNQAQKCEVPSGE